MYLKILACDLDGTLAHDGNVDPETWEILRKARSKGITLMLVTGRRLDTFSADGPFAELFEAIIAEDGAAVYFTRNNEVRLPFGRLDDTVIQQNKEKNIPFEQGTAIMATWMPYIDAVEEVLHETGRSATIEYNKGAVMILPPGATKGTGLRFALEELGYSEHNVVACGDAENDRSLFEIAEFSVAVANATPELKALSDYVLPFPRTKGIRHLVEHLCQNQLPHSAKNKHNYLSIGKQADGSTFHIPPKTFVDGNLGFFGASASGKSWMAGLLAESLLQKGYQICIIDPEGDYASLRAFSHTLVLGSGDNILPPPEEVITLSEYTNVSLILDLSIYEVDERLAYVTNLMQAFLCLRSQRGRPHWILIDEIHSFCPQEGGPLTDLVVKGMQEKGLGIVSYRPSLVAPAILEAIDVWLLTRMEMPEEIEKLKSLIPQSAGFSDAIKQLPAMPVGDALFLAEKTTDGSDAGSFVNFRVAKRKVPHVRHLHKYLRAALPHPKRFYFNINGNATGHHPATSLWDFREAIKTVPINSLKYHLQRKDFEKWVHSVFHDDELVRSIRKVRHRYFDDDQLRHELDQVVSQRYEELESLI